MPPITPPGQTPEDWAQSAELDHLQRLAAGLLVDGDVASLLQRNYEELAPCRP